MRDENVVITEELLIPKSIHELLGEKFYIPSYQRGYRWGRKQIIDLLEDIHAFSLDDTKNFYCLQPLIVKRDNGNKYWEVIDGQQRLTTIYIILKYFFEECQLIYGKNKDFNLYTLEYETRGDSVKFLAKINEENKSIENKNIDYCFMQEAYHIIDKWCNDKKSLNILDFIKSIILSDELTKGHNLRFIWYEAKDSDKVSNNSIDVFTRINGLKIPLTNAELVKARLLQASNYSSKKANEMDSNEQKELNNKQLQLAYDWDEIEKKLCEESFWAFLYNTNDAKAKNYDNHIEYILDIIYQKNKNDEDNVFSYFNDEINKSSPAEVWREIKDYYMRLLEWHNDYYLYHYIGYLIYLKVDILELLKLSEESKSKSEFKASLKDKIKETLEWKDSIELEYNSKKPLIRNILLLFNIQTLLDTKKEDTRFSFAKYKNEQWDIEHIHSQAESNISSNAKSDWIKNTLDYFKKEKQSEEQSKIINDLEALLVKIENQKFEECFENIKHYFIKEDYKYMNSLANLTLLDSTTNRSYGNTFFQIKRSWIIDNDKNGIFIPICTKNVFLKYYSTSSSSNLYWTNEDAEEYENAIYDTLKDFIYEDE